MKTQKPHVNVPKKFAKEHIVKKYKKVFKMTELQRDKTFESSGISGKLKIVLHDVSGTLIRALGTIERRGYDYRDVHCTQRVDGDFDLLVHIEDTGGPSNLDTLCKQLERLYNVVSAEKVGRRKHAERA